MKKLLLLSSLSLFFFTTVLTSCKVKKDIKKTAESAEVIDESTNKEAQNGVVVPSPGTLNQKQLDSIKSIRNKEKRINK